MLDEQILTVARNLLAATGETVLDFSAAGDLGAAGTKWPRHLLLAWALLCMPDGGVAELQLPRQMAGRLALERTGVLPAARRRSVALRSDQTTETSGLRPRLANDDWEVESWDQSAAAANPGYPLHLRVLRDLENPARTPYVVNDQGRSFLWLNKLGLRSVHCDGEAYKTLIGDIDTTLFELVDNVHRWARATRAIATVAVTKGGADSQNRLHLVVIDNGRGILGSINDDPLAKAALEAHAGDDGADSSSLIKFLLTHAFGDRNIPGHQGHGLHSSQVCASRWGRLDLFTTDGEPDSSVLHVSAEGPNNVRVEDSLELPGLRGTALHVTFRADAPKNRSTGDSTSDVPGSLVTTASRSA